MRINDRQQQIINLLCQRRSDTVQNLAAELGVCERTIRRDIEELTLTHPLETVRGRYGGGVKMADWYFRDRPKLSPKQTALLKRLAVGLHGEDLDEMNHIMRRPGQSVQVTRFSGRRGSGTGSISTVWYILRRRISVILSSRETSSILKSVRPA